MIELVFNEFLSTFPFFILAYLPVCDRMRFAFKKSFLIMCVWESVYLCLFALLVIFGSPSVSAQYLAIPVLFALMVFLVETDIGIAAFLFYLQSIIFWLSGLQPFVSARKFFIFHFLPGRPGSSPWCSP